MTRVIDYSTHTPVGADKVAAYGWVMKNKPGTLRLIPKGQLRIDQTYQRDIIPQKVKLITQSWSWISLGALVVGERDGQLWVIDGQHRAMAAARRSDVTHLPCVVFETADVKEEARGFLDLNTGRKPVTAVGKQKALVAAGDEVAVFVQHQIDANGLVIVSNPKAACQFKAVAWCVRRAAEDRGAFVTVLQIAAELSRADSIPIPEKLLEGLWVLQRKCEGGLSGRLLRRVRETGAERLVVAANRASAFYANGGGKVWAQGMLSEMNKGLRIRFTLDGEPAP